MTYLNLFLTFLKIGAFTFGGGYAMLPLIQAEVEAQGWMAAEELINFIAVSESTPGPFAVNVSTYVGQTVGGLPGAFCATLGVVLPSFVIILIAARCFARFQNSPAVKGCMSGLRPAVVGLIGAAVITTGKSVFFPEGMSAAAFMQPQFLYAAVIFAIMLALALKKVHPVLIICLSAVMGIVASYL